MLRFSQLFRQTIIASAFLAAFGVASAREFGPTDTTTMSTRVSLAGLDLNTDEGVAIAHKRIAAGARMVCRGAIAPSESSWRDATDECRAEAERRAYVKLAVKYAMFAPRAKTYVLASR